MSYDAHVYVQSIKVILFRKVTWCSDTSSKSCTLYKLFVKFDCGGMYVCIVMEMSYGMYVWKILKCLRKYVWKL